ncbi:hypothetical protein ACB092_06G165900 [Castanea dentata]
MESPSPSPSPSPSRPSTQTPAAALREDCWSEDATHTLIEAWGDRYLDLNRGNLRQRHWQEVAAAVNARHATSKSFRSDIQCKNRIDTLKKKYKIEKAKATAACVSAWPFFASLDSLLGSSFPKPSTAAPRRNTPPWNLSTPIPVGPRTHKRPAPSPAVDSSFRRNFTAAAAEGGDGSDGPSKEEKEVEKIGYRELAQAIERFGEIYERVEGAKQKQMMELEKQRMQFTKDLECHRMQLLLETQVQLQKIKRARRQCQNGYS